MTKKLLAIVLTGMFSTTAFAADLYVRNAGTGGAYATISAAITAASDGDRIIIQPKTNGTAYVENLTIYKSLTFISETIYNKYLIQGSVTISPAAGRVVTISNMSLVNNSNYNLTVSGATSGGRTTVNIYNSLLNSVSAGLVNTTTNMSGNTLQGGITISHGRITSNKAESIGVYSFAADTSVASPDVEVYGNAIRNVLSNYQSNYNFKFYNNFCSHIMVNGIKDGSSNEILNNTVYDPNPGDIPPFYISLNSNTITGNISIMNNASSFVVGQTAVCIQNNSSNANVTASYNVFTNAFVTQGTMTQSNNSGQVNMNFDNAAYTVTGMNVNAGSPVVDYTDLDLTRNDAGHYGGSNSWANYWPIDSGGKPQVNYLLTPRTISSGTLNITGSAFSK